MSGSLSGDQTDPSGSKRSHLDLGYSRTTAEEEPANRCGPNSFTGSSTFVRTFSRVAVFVDAASSAGAAVEGRGQRRGGKTASPFHFSPSVTTRPLTPLHPLFLLPLRVWSPPLAPVWPRVYKSRRCRPGSSPCWAPLWQEMAEHSHSHHWGEPYWDQ